MGDLLVNAEALRASGATLREGAARVPTSSVGVDATGCGSQTVIASADEFSMWLAITARTTAGKLRVAAEAVELAATNYDETDLALAEAN